ncbi:MAG TPA: hypothetical protein V6D14_13260 [Coleofasciculaceae cyanobacterium]|jgi:hypothetical protein
MFQPPSLPDLNLQLLATIVISGLLIGVVLTYTWQQYKQNRVNLFSKKLIPVYSASIVGLFLLSLLTQPHFREISPSCKNYQLQKTLYSSTPANPSCDREIAKSEATYLAAYPVLGNRQSLPGYLGLLAVGGGVVIALRAQGSVGRTRRGVLRPRILRDT